MNEPSNCGCGYKARELGPDEHAIHYIQTCPFCPIVDETDYPIALEWPSTQNPDGVMTWRPGCPDVFVAVSVIPREGQFQLQDHIAYAHPPDGTRLVFREC